VTVGIEIGEIAREACGTRVPPLSSSLARRLWTESRHRHLLADEYGIAGLEKDPATRAPFSSSINRGAHHHPQPGYRHVPIVPCAPCCERSSPPTAPVRQPEGRASHLSDLSRHRSPRQCRGARIPPRPRDRSHSQLTWRHPRKCGPGQSATAGVPAASAALRAMARSAASMTLSTARACRQVGTRQREPAQTGALPTK